VPVGNGVGVGTGVGDGVWVGVDVGVGAGLGVGVEFGGGVGVGVGAAVAAAVAVAWGVDDAVPDWHAAARHAATKPNAISRRIVPVSLQLRDVGPSLHTKTPSGVIRTASPNVCRP